MGGFLSFFKAIFAYGDPAFENHGGFFFEGHDFTGLFFNVFALLRYLFDQRRHMGKAAVSDIANS